MDKKQKVQAFLSKDRSADITAIIQGRSHEPDPRIALLSRVLAQYKAAEAPVALITGLQDAIVEIRGQRVNRKEVRHAARFREAIFRLKQSDLSRLESSDAAAKMGKGEDPAPTSDADRLLLLMLVAEQPRFSPEPKDWDRWCDALRQGRPADALAALERQLKKFFQVWRRYWLMPFQSTNGRGRPRKQESFEKYAPCIEDKLADKGWDEIARARFPARYAKDPEGTSDKIRRYVERYLNVRRALLESNKEMADAMEDKTCDFRKIATGKEGLLRKDWEATFVSTILANKLPASAQGRLKPKTRTSLSVARSVWRTKLDPREQQTD